MTDDKLSPAIMRDYFHEWARRHEISPLALAELRALLTAETVQYDRGPRAPRNEADVQNLVRVEASQKGCRLWRNNVGAAYDENGNFFRFGLANESAKMNQVVKSADLIGIRPVLIQPSHVGTTIGQFVSREIKAPGWRYSGSEREQRQLAWARMVSALGGDAGFAAGVGTL